MKRLENCKVENCIPTPSSCVEWNGGTIEYLGICDGDSLNTLLWEVLNKLEEIAGTDLSEFDLDSLLSICNQNAPLEVTLISILNILKNNQVCLKDFIDNLSEQLAELLNESTININLKCYAEFDNLGNSLSITRDELDQLIIDNLCNHKDRIETLEGKVISLQSQIDNLSTSTSVDELNIATCIDPVEKPTSSQVVTTAQALCDYQDAVGPEADISSALANTPADMNTEFGLLPGWILAPTNWAENYNNLLIAFGNVWARLQAVEVCCEATCDDVKLGFTALFNETGDGLIIRFTSGAGTALPSGFVDKGSTGTITDIDGNIVDFTIDIVDNFSGNETEVFVSGLNLNGDLTVDITAKIGNEGLTCEKCLHKIARSSACGYCEITATGEEGSAAVIVYEDDAVGVVSYNNTTTTSTSTTTSSSTTTTTTGV